MKYLKSGAKEYGQYVVDKKEGQHICYFKDGKQEIRNYKAGERQ